MNILVIGSGAREHAIVRALERSPKDKEIFCLGSNVNPGIAKLCTDLTVANINDTHIITSYAKKRAVDLAIIGPENPLAVGAADVLWDRADNCQINRPFLGIAGYCVCIINIRNRKISTKFCDTRIYVRPQTEYFFIFW